MVLDGLSAVGALDLLVGGRVGNTEDFVVIALAQSSNLPAPSLILFCFGRCLVRSCSNLYQRRTKQAALESIARLQFTDNLIVGESLRLLPHQGLMAVGIKKLTRGRNGFPIPFWVSTSLNCFRNEFKPRLEVCNRLTFRNLKAPFEYVQNREQLAKKVGKGIVEKVLLFPARSSYGSFSNSA